MRRRSMKRRSGYTLLEVILAIGIGLLLVASLYAALNVQSRYMQNGRHAVAEGHLARGLLRRLAADIRLGLARPPIPWSQAGQKGSSGEPWHFGIIGDEQQIMLFQTTVPSYRRPGAEAQVDFSDLRRVTYELMPGQGLCRRESRNVTGQQDLATEGSFDLLAAEVVGLRFRYFDDLAQAWVPTWESRMRGLPHAVEIILVFQQQGSMRPKPTSYPMVVAVPAAGMSPELMQGHVELGR